MSEIFEIFIFMVVVGVIWYILQTKNLLGLGANFKSSKDALKNTLVFVIIAGIVFYILGQVI